MFTVKFKKTEPTALEDEIDRLYEILKTIQPTDEDYDKVSEQYVKLSKLQIETNSKKRVSPDALAGAATNLAGILLVLNFERVNIIATKAFGMVAKSIK